MSILTATFFKIDNIGLELDRLKFDRNEKEKLLKMANEVAEYRFIDLILEKLEEKDKELFLEQLHSGSQALFIEFLRERIENLEDILTSHAKILEDEILEDIRQLKQ